MINYWWEVVEVDDQYTVIIKANSDTINIEECFDTEGDAEFYAESYIKGYKDARGEA